MINEAKRSRYQLQSYETLIRFIFLIMRTADEAFFHFYQIDDLAQSRLTLTEAFSST